MKFGEVSVATAAGAVLAHSVGVSGKRLRKGIVLTSQDIEALEASGHETVVVARLSASDVDENTAARRLAAALAPDPVARGVQIKEAFTGRVNLVAVHPGVVALDEDALREVNRIDPMITCATVPAFQQMAPGGLVATIKIISYGVDAGHLDAACAAAGDGIRVLPPVAKTVELIVTDIPGGAGDKGREAIENRLMAFGIQMAPPVRVPHQTGALTAALAGSTADVVLILTGSATSDLHDVAPAALIKAGGDVARFGMPVDPGNLLFLGSLQGRPVIGLPGCARSPALNGADWVLSRIICGVDVTSDDIAAMAVGGLLKEIPTRPQPRRPR
ncbi:MAG: molybdopterin-binding protein [Roseobacter sp.]